MNVLYLNSANNTFNHVLAIFTRTSEPAKLETDASGFVGAGLVVRDFLQTPLVIPSSMIGVFAVPFDSSFFSQPRSVYGASAPGQSGLSMLVSFTNAVVTPAFAKPTLTIPIAGTSPTTPVLILLQGPAMSTPQEQQATISGTSQKVDLAGLVSGNTYYALIFVPQYPIMSCVINT